MLRCIYITFHNHFLLIKIYKLVKNLLRFVALSLIFKITRKWMHWMNNNGNLCFPCIYICNIRMILFHGLIFCYVFGMWFNLLKWKTMKERKKANLSLFFYFSHLLVPKFCAMYVVLFVCNYMGSSALVGSIIIQLLYVWRTKNSMWVWILFLRIWFRNEKIDKWRWKKREHVPQNVNCCSHIFFFWCCKCVNVDSTYIRIHLQIVLQ